MPKKTRSFGSWRQEKLANPEIAANYLNAALEDSPEAFLGALRNVAQARKMKTVAEESGVTRESLYRSLSKEGNPTLGTLHSVLEVLGLKIAVEPEKTEPATPGSVSGIRFSKQQLEKIIEASNVNSTSIETHAGPTTNAAARTLSVYVGHINLANIGSGIAKALQEVVVPNYLVGCGTGSGTLPPPEADPFRLNWMNQSNEQQKRKRPQA